MNLATGKPFEDGEHILYVNGEYRGDSDIGRLMHDFGCTSADEMNYPLLADRTRYLKENQKGVGEMCKLIEDMRMEERAEGIREGMEKGMEKGMLDTAKRMLEDGKLALEKIAEYSGLPLEEVLKLKNT